MRQCPYCRAIYADDEELCAADGRVLFDPDPLLGRVIDGKYRIDYLIGSGGQGAVYEATHVHLHRTAALKIVQGDFFRDSASVDRFRSEALTIARLSHPHIVTVHDFGLSDDLGAYLVMERLGGRSLRDELRGRRRLAPGEAIDLVRQICDAVGTAHEAGVIHRDLKPDNVYVERGPALEAQVKILDFGIAQILGDEGIARAETERRERTTTGRIFGTPVYMSPEQCQNLTLDARTDIYSIGCMLYELVAGRPPFVGARVSEVLRKHVQELPMPPSTHALGIPKPLDDVILHALEKDPERRFQTIDELDAALARVRELWGAVVARSSGPQTATRDDEEDDATPTLVDAVLPQHNLPRQMTAFIGREEQMASSEKALTSSRLVTLTGPSGSGKTRLSIQIGLDLLSDFPDGVWMVELAGVADGSLVPRAVGAALGVAERAAGSIIAALLEFLNAKRLLLVMDNCEHLLDACIEFVSLVLRSCRGVRVLATSQEALKLPGEINVPVPTLDLPSEAAGTTKAEIAKAEAVRLFVDRARLANAHFTLTDENAAYVARVCRRLDGIPLAIELAAARTKLLTVEQIDARLDNRFRLLTSGSRTAEPRQRTLEAAIDWSYDLLDASARTLFARLSVFAGGFTLEAAEAICVGGAIARTSFHDLLAHLVDRSLVTVATRKGSTRYRMLETLRQYGAARLADADEERAIRSRHRDYFLDLAESAAPELKGPDQREWLDRLGIEHDNLRAALEWARDDGDGATLARYARALLRFWMIRGHFREGQAWTSLAVALGGESDEIDRGQVLYGAGVFAWVLGDFATALAMHEDALRQRRATDDPGAVAASLNAIGFVHQARGEYENAERCHREAYDLAESVGERWEEASALNNLGIVARHKSDLELGEALLSKGLAIFRDLGDAREIGNALNNLSVIAGVKGDFWRALELIEENLALRRAIGDKRGVATSLLNIGEIKRLMGDFDSAADLLRRSLSLFDEIGDSRNVAYALEGLMLVAAAEKQHERALRLAGATAALRAAIGSTVTPAELAAAVDEMVATRRAVGEERAGKLLAAGRSMTRAQAVHYALEGVRIGR